MTAKYRTVVFEDKELQKVADKFNQFFKALDNVNAGVKFHSIIQKTDVFYLLVGYCVVEK